MFLILFSFSNCPFFFLDAILLHYFPFFVFACCIVVLVHPFALLWSVYLFVGTIFVSVRCLQHQQTLAYKIIYYHHLCIVRWYLSRMLLILSKIFCFTVTTMVLVLFRVHVWRSVFIFQHKHTYNLSICRCNCFAYVQY